VKRILLIGGSLFIIIGLVLGYFWFKDNIKSLLGKQKNECPTLQSPVDTAIVTSVLYPGQLRGGDYKAHGGFRFDGLNNNVTVKAPISAKLTRAGRYIEIDEVQYIFIFETNCGLTYRFDHLLTLVPKFQAIVDKLPPAKEGRVNFEDIHPTINVKTGETIATAVGFREYKGMPNVSFDFGVYLDKNGKKGLCWLDLLPPEDTARLKTLPGGDNQSGKTSDYCH
jgi:hypothetical protein